MEKNEMREVIAKRAAKELHDGDVVNLGIGIPTLIPNYLPEGVTVTLQTENGAMGMGPTPRKARKTRTSSTLAVAPSRCFLVPAPSTRPLRSPSSMAAM